MEYKNITINYKSIALIAFLAVFPNFLGMLNIPTIWGFKIHLFQYLIFVAAAVYGPVGGLTTGFFGSFYTAFALNNPYIVVGNMLLGFFTGLLINKGLKLIIAVMLAFVIQIPWLWLTDVYLVGMPINVVNGLVIGLLVSNLVWGTMASYSYKSVASLVK